MVSACSTVETATGEVLAALGAGMPLVVVHGARGTGRTTVCDRVRTRVGDTGVLLVDDADRHDDLAGHIDRSAPPGTPVVLALADASVVGALPSAPTWVLLDSLTPADVADLAAHADIGHASPGAIRRLGLMTGGNLRTLIELLAVLPGDSLSTWETLGSEHLRSLPVTVEARNELSRLGPSTRAALCLAAHADDEPLAAYGSACRVPAIPIPRPRECERGATYPECKWQMPAAPLSDGRYRRWRNTIVEHWWGRPSLVTYILATMNEFDRLQDELARDKNRIDQFRQLMKQARYELAYQEAQLMVQEKTVKGLPTPVTTTARPA